MVLALQAPYYRPMPKKRPATNLAPAKTALGRFVREQRDARGWSQDELAARAGANLTFTNISNIERGKVGLPDPPAMIGIASAFGMHVADLYVKAGFPDFAMSGADARAVGEVSPEYDATFEEIVVPDDEYEPLKARMRHVVQLWQEERNKAPAKPVRATPPSKVVRILFERRDAEEEPAG